MVSDVPVDNKASVVTSEIFRSVGAKSFEGAHRNRVCIRVFIGMSVRALWTSTLYCVILKKKVMLVLEGKKLPCLGRDGNCTTDVGIRRFQIRWVWVWISN